MAATSAVEAAPAEEDEEPSDLKKQVLYTYYV